jgi:hypothetical protein
MIPAAIKAMPMYKSKIWILTASFLSTGMSGFKRYGYDFEYTGEGTPLLAKIIHVADKAMLRIPLNA